MKTEKVTDSNKTGPNSTEQTSLQFGLSISIGVLTILIIAASLYTGIIH